MSRRNKINKNIFRHGRRLSRNVQIRDMFSALHPVNSTEILWWFYKEKKWLTFEEASILGLRQLCSSSAHPSGRGTSLKAHKRHVKKYGREGTVYCFWNRITGNNFYYKCKKRRKR